METNGADSPLSRSVGSGPSRRLVDGRSLSRAPICSAGAHLFFLPPYSPDLNPIEQVFAKLKAVLRRAAERSVEATWQRMGQILQCFTPQECANYFRNAGYASI